MFPNRDTIKIMHHGCGVLVWQGDQLDELWGWTSLLLN
jgi:hypothetical protein